MTKLSTVKLDLDNYNQRLKWMSLQLKWNEND